MTTKRTHSQSLAAGVMALLVALIGLGGVANAEKLKVMSSIAPLAELTQGVLGDLGEVEALIPDGMSPHSFSLKPRQVADLQKADAIVMNGLGLETFLDDVLKNVPDYETKVIDASMDLPTAELEAITQQEVTKIGKEPASADGHVHGEHCNHGNSADPHVWLNPQYAQIMVDTIAKGIAAAAPKHEKALLENAKALKKKLFELDQEIAGMFIGVDKYPVITFHDAYRYFFRRYKLPLAAVVRTLPEEQPAPKELARLYKVIEEEGVKVIMTEPQFDSALAETIAKEKKLKVMTLDPIGKRGKGGAGYFETLRFNAKAMLDAQKAR